MSFWRRSSNNWRTQVDEEVIYCQSPSHTDIERAISAFRRCPGFNNEDAESIRDKLTRQPEDFQLFYSPPGIWAHTEIRRHSSQTSLWLHFAASEKNNLSELKIYQKLLDSLSEYAKKQKCEVLFFYGRPGWCKVLKNCEHDTIFIKAL